MNRHHAKLLALGIVTSGWVSSAFGQTQATPQRRQGNGHPATAESGRQQPEAFSRFQTLQTLQASLQTSASLLNLSLLDFLS